MKNIKDLISAFLSADKTRNTKEKEYSSKLGEFTIPISSLIERFPPRYSNAYKRMIWSQIENRWLASQLYPGEEDISVSQYKGIDTNFMINKPGDTDISSVDFYFDYKESDKDATRWYLNFADPNLFVAYGSDLFAQDEIQCLEHPLLGSIREYMLSSDVDTMSVSTITKNCPTPILIERVPYMVDVKTTISVGGVDYSIYGNAFRHVQYDNPDLLGKAIHVKDRFTTSNIIAMCAPYPEIGKYRKETIRYLLSCAMTAFGAAKERTQNAKVEIHTGRWGAGAFGGNEELSIIVQLLAANICGIHSLVFHAVSPAKLNAAKDACKELFEMTKDDSFISDIVNHLHSLEYEWGVSDGN